MEPGLCGTPGTSVLACHRGGAEKLEKKFKDPGTLALEASR